MQHQNRLAQEHSPYLLQHANNPVDWYAWGEEAFLAARSADLPIFLSIGYSTCYWCHVMEHESFEDQEVADALKGRFIAIKLDREERPDVDSIYMDAVVGLTGHGGWPMSVFLTPQLEPFWGGTYFPKDRFLKVLDALSNAWQSDRSKIDQTALQITAALKERSQRQFEGELDSSIFERAAVALQKNFDRQYGGFGSAPKFPPTEQCRFLMRQGRQENNSEYISMATYTLEHMARGGIFDQLAGGFSRYSVDQSWSVPHFEKMLYDNALLVPAYLEAYQLTHNQIFADVANKVLEYLLATMQSPQGGFYAAEDAGEVRREGEYYVWSYTELKSLLDENQLAHLKEFTTISENGNFENNTNVLNIKPGSDWNTRFSEPIASAFATLLQARLKRTRPHLDDKIITAWNGFAITAFSRAAYILNNKDYALTAKKCIDFIKSSLLCTGELLRSHHRGHSSKSACLEDYAALIEGILAYYQVSGDREYLELANSLQSNQNDQLWDEANSLYKFSPASDLIIEQFEKLDGATPSGNSITLKNLATFEILVENLTFSHKRKRMLQSMAGLLSSYPQAACKALEGIQFKFQPITILALPRRNPTFANSILNSVRMRFIAPLVISWNDDLDAHFCYGEKCSAPCGDLDLLLTQMQEYGVFQDNFGSSA